MSDPQEQTGSDAPAEDTKPADESTTAQGDGDQQGGESSERSEGEQTTALDS